MYWQCTDESLSPRRKQNHTTKFFTEVTQFYSFILSRRCLRRSGQSRREKNNKICVKIEFYFFSISSKNNVGGSVNHKIKKVWPKVLFLVCAAIQRTAKPVTKINQKASKKKLLRTIHHKLNLWVTRECMCFTKFVYLACMIRSLFYSKFKEWW